MEQTDRGTYGRIATLLNAHCSPIGMGSRLRQMKVPSPQLGSGNA